MSFPFNTLIHKISSVTHWRLFFACCTVLVGLFPPLISAKPQPLGLKIGLVDISFKPYHIVQNGYATGPDVDVIRRVMERIDSEYNVILLPQKRATDYLFKGRIDISVLFKMQRYEKQVVFGELPLHASTYRLAVLENSVFKFNQMSDLYGRQEIGVVFGNSIGTEFDKAVADRLIMPTQVNAFAKLPELLLLGRVKAVAVNERIFTYYLNQSDSLSKVKFLPKPIGDKRYFHLAVSRRIKAIDAVKLTQLMDEALTGMLHKGEIAQIYTSYGLSMHYYDPDWTQANLEGATLINSN